MTIEKLKDKEVRRFAEFELRAVAENLAQDEKEELYVEGYAATFNSPTVLYEVDGIEHFEKIDDKAFDEADMSDVIFNYNHQGKVMARTRNKTLQITTDDKGLYIRARLDGTDEGRKLYEEINGGYLDRMSFSFITREDSYDMANHTRTIQKVKKLYDVSSVDIPAYDDTSISARSLFEAQQELVEQEQKLIDDQKQMEQEHRKKLILMTYL